MSTTYIQICYNRESPESYHLGKMEFLLSAKDCQLNSRPWGLALGHEQIMDNTRSMICYGHRTQKLNTQDLVMCWPLGNPTTVTAGFSWQQPMRGLQAGISYCRTVVFTLSVSIEAYLLSGGIYYLIHLSLFTLSANLGCCCLCRRGPTLACGVPSFINSIATSCLYDLLWGQWTVPRKPWQSLADNKNSIFPKW